MRKKAPIDIENEKIARTLNVRDLTRMNNHLGKAFAHVWSLSLIAQNQALNDLGNKEAEVILSEAAMELEEAKVLLNQSMKVKKAP